MKVLFAGGGTGGHLMPALALADAMAAVHPAIEPVFVGAERGLEARVLPERGVAHYLLPVQPIHRHSWWKNITLPGNTARVLHQCSRLLEVERPALAVGTGGYASGAVLFATHRKRIPIALQEQNAFPGLTTRLLARWARQIHLGFPEARSHLHIRDARVFDYGNPIAPPPAPMPSKEDARRTLGIDPERPAIMIMGGSQGARALNRVVKESLAAGSFGEIVVLWSTGEQSWEAYRELHRPPDCLIRAFWDPIADAYAASDLVVARAGAMTTAELCAWGLPAILVPLPTAAAQHQAKNADALQAAGAAVHLPESELTSERLIAELRRVLDTASIVAEMGRNARARGAPNAAQRTASEILTLVG